MKKNWNVQFDKPDDLYAKKEAEINPLKPLNKKPPQQPQKVKTKEPKPSLIEGQSNTLEINVQLSIGKLLSSQLDDVVNQHNQSLTAIMTASRNNAIQELISILDQNIKPTIEDVAKGGHKIRFKYSFNNDEAKLLKNWFDPFNIGTTKETIKQLMNQLLQTEIKSLVKSNH